MRQSKEAIDRISAAMKKRMSDPAERAKISKANLGSRMSDETKAQMSATRSRMYQDGTLKHPMKKYEPTKEEVEAALNKYGNQKGAGKALGMSQMSLSRYKRKFGIEYDGKKNSTQTLGKGQWVNGVYMRSSWEVAFAKLLVSLGIEYEYESRNFKLASGKHYRPDFFIREFDIWIEIKGFWWPQAKVKFDQFISEFPEINLVVIEHEIWKTPANDFVNFLSTKLDLEKSTRLISRMSSMQP